MFATLLERRQLVAAGPCLAVAAPLVQWSRRFGAYRELWNQPGLDDRATINDNMLVTVMIETLEGVVMASEIAATHGVDVVMIAESAQFGHLNP